MDFQEFLEKIGKTFDQSILATVLTIGILFVLFYFTISTLKKNNAGWVILVFVVYILSTGTIFMLAEISGWDYFIIPLLFIVVVMALFATEIKRDIWDLKNKKNTKMVMT